jgi:hypothetical protein
MLERRDMLSLESIDVDVVSQLVTYIYWRDINRNILSRSRREDLARSRVHSRLRARTVPCALGMLLSAVTLFKRLLIASLVPPRSETKLDLESELHDATLFYNSTGRTPPKDVASVGGLLQGWIYASTQRAEERFGRDRACGGNGGDWEFARLRFVIGDSCCTALRQYRRLYRRLLLHLLSSLLVLSRLFAYCPPPSPTCIPFRS